MIKRFLLFCSILILSVSCAHAWVAASGSVTLANKKLSLVNGTAFADFSAANVLTDYIGMRLVVTDSAGKKAVGYIKAVGTGETLGDELVSNGTFDSDTTGWAADGSALLSSVAGGVSGNCLQVTENGALNPATVQIIPVTQGRLYKITASVKQGSSSTYRMYPYGTAMPYRTQDRTSTSSWTTLETLTYGASPYALAKDTSSVWLVLLAVASKDSGLTHLFDNVTFKQVLTPSATGVTITSTPNGSTYNWTSIESGFNFNDASGYTYVIHGASTSGIGKNLNIGKNFR